MSKYDQILINFRKMILTIFPQLNNLTHLKMVKTHCTLKAIKCRIFLMVNLHIPINLKNPKYAHPIFINNEN
jgi:hypothetical protein